VEAVQLHRIAFDALYARYKVNRDDYALEPIGFSRAGSQGGKPETIIRDAVVDENNSLVYGLSTMSNCVPSTTATISRNPAIYAVGHADIRRSVHLARTGGTFAVGLDNFVDLSMQIDALTVDNFSYDIRGNRNLPASTGASMSAIRQLLLRRSCDAAGRDRADRTRNPPAPQLYQELQ
jgi:iron complex outermembrane receptor protein